MEEIENNQLNEAESAPPRTQPPATRSWIWSFIGIALVAVVLIGWLALFISQQFEKQLTLDQLQVSRKLWQTKGPKDYQMVYAVQRGDKSKDQYFVVVRGGVVQSVVLNKDTRLPPDKAEYHSMQALLSDIEIFLKRDAQPGSPKVYCRGNFASEDGHLMWFLRRVIEGSERVDIKVEEFRIVDGK